MQDSEDIWDDLADKPAWEEVIGHPAWLTEDPRTTNYQLRDPDYPMGKVAWTIGANAVSAYRLPGARVGRVPNGSALVIASHIRRNFLIRYLLGVPVPQLAAELEELRSFRPAGRPNPLERTWFGAIAVLLRNDEAVKWAISDRHLGKNFLFDSYRRLETVSRATMWDDGSPDDGLLETIDLQLAGEHEAASRRVFDYVDAEWYDEYEGRFWHGTRDGGKGGYYGYWCFEAAAINQIYGIDDTQLRDHPHYPTDLVDYCRATAADA